jgi:D-threo-aldose 1-dehydrogenase
VTSTLPRARLGRTDVDVTRFSLGGAPLGGLFSPVDDEDATATLEAAWQGGVRSFDTAPLYGHGLSEHRVGAFLATKPRDSFVLSTKVGRLLSNDEALFDFSRDGIRASLEASLERLGLDRVDIALIHDPDDHLDEAMHKSYPALEELRAEGLVRAIGLGMNQAEMLERFVRDTDVDCVLVAGRYSLLDNRAAAGLFPAAIERGVSVLVGGAFNGGILTDSRLPVTFDYQPAPASLVARAENIRAIAARHNVSLAHVAIQFVLRNPAVTSVVVGARSPAEIADDLGMFSSAIPDALWSELEASGLLGWRDPDPDEKGAQ